MLAQAFEFVKTNGIAGDYFEFGLWQGKTFCWARRMAHRYGVRNIIFRGFDSFQGLPASSERKYNIWSSGQFACDRSHFERNLTRGGFRRGEYELVEGFYDRSLTPELAGTLLERGVRAAIVYVDCDIYESTRDVLGFIRPFLQDGTVICFDDYFAFRGQPGMGEQRAITEFLHAWPEIDFQPYLVYGPVGMSMLCSVRST